jgi:hypothetical protein
MSLNLVATLRHFILPQLKQNGKQHLTTAGVATEPQADRADHEWREGYVCVVSHAMRRIRHKKNPFAFAGKRADLLQMRVI